MLAAVDPRLLERVRFPLGEQTKAETRAEAAAAGLVAAGRPRARRRASSAATTTAPSSSAGRRGARTGDVVDANGARLGAHDGHWRFTPGQRRGLGVSAARPLYVLRTDAATNTVVGRLARRARDDEVSRLAAVCTGRCDACRGEAPLPLRSRPGLGDGSRATASSLHLDDPVSRCRAGPVRSAVRGRRGGRRGAIANVA